MLTYITITGTFNYRTTPTKTPAAGEVIEFVPRTAARPDGSEVLLPKTLSTTLNVSGQIPAGFSLPTLPGGVYYTVRETFEGGRGKYTILVNPGDPTTDLCDVAPVVPPPLLVSTRGPVGPPGPQPPLSNQVPAALGTAAPGIGTKAAREDHIHALPTAAQVGADASGAATAAVASHVGAADPHPQYTTAAEAAAAAPVQTVAGRTGNVTLATADVTGAVDTSDARLSDARTPTAHTHPLSDLTQSGATTNQVPQWNGAAWVPATVSGGGGSGDVVGPASSTDGYISLFDGTTGKLLKDGGLPLSAIPGRTIAGGGTISYRMGTAYGSIDPNVNGSYLFDGRVEYPNKLGINNTKPVDSPTVITRSNDTSYVSGGAAVAAILAGYDNVNNALAGIIASQHSMLYSDATHACIFGGSLHSILAGADYAGIFGGSDCAIEIDCDYASIIGSNFCKVETGATTNESGFRAFIGGSLSSIAGGRQAFIGGSTSANIQTTYSAVISGDVVTLSGTGSHLFAAGNSITIGNLANTSYSTAFGHDIAINGSRAFATGDNHTIGIGHDYSSVAGTRCITPFAGAHVRSSRHRANVAGRNQELSFSCSQETSDTTTTRLSTYGASGYPTQPNDSIVSGTVYVTGVNTATGECSTYKIDFTSQRLGSGTPTLRANTTTTIYNGLALPTAPTMNTTTGGIFRVQVVGLASTSIAWHAVFHGQQIVFTP